MNKKTKIYIFNSASRAANYGIGTYIENLTKALRQAGCEYGLVFMHDRQSSEATITVKEGIQHITIPAAQMLKQEDGERYEQNTAFVLRSLIPKERNVQYIFHLNFMGSDALIGQLKKLFKCKIILTVHYTNWSFALNGDFAKLKRLYLSESKANAKTKATITAADKELVRSVKHDIKTMNRVDQIICVARHTFDEYHALGGLRKTPVEIIANALPNAYKPLNEQQLAALRRKYHIESDEYIVLFAGRIDPVKGVKDIIQAFKAIVHKHNNVRLLIAGDGDFNPCLNQANAYWTKVTFTGKVDKQTLYELYSIAALGMVCSLHEEFGYVAIEMMMHALPVIVTQTSGLEEIVEDGTSGLKVPVRLRKGQRVVDEKRLTEAMEYMLTHPQEARTLGDNARKRFLEKYELSLFREKMTAVYQSLTETK